MLEEAPVQAVDTGPCQEPPSKKSKTIDLCRNDTNDDTDGYNESEQVWLFIPGCFLTMSDKDIILNAKEQLNDRHINFSQ
ncbi:MAG: hypothetical protein K0U11_01915 [Gammaproteobacteria bacterium]|nr:hypothetical protein [Gammaproteobacteria bacterium]